MNLLLPTDGCPACITVEHVAITHPHKVEDDPAGDGIAAYYRCPECGYSWWTGWSREAASVPCPGCPACAAVAGAA